MPQVEKENKRKNKLKINEDVNVTTEIATNPASNPLLTSLTEFIAYCVSCPGAVIPKLVPKLVQNAPPPKQKLSLGQFLWFLFGDIDGNHTVRLSGVPSDTKPLPWRRYGT